MEIRIKTICCIVAGYLEETTMKIMVDKYPDLKFNVVDINKERIASWNTNISELPIFKTGLKDFNQHLKKRFPTGNICDFLFKFNQHYSQIRSEYLLLGGISVQ